MNTTTCWRCHQDFPDGDMIPLPDEGEVCPSCARPGDEIGKPTVRLTAAQTASAKARVEECKGGWTYWTKDKSAPVYPSRREAEEASIQEWRDNL